MISTKLNSTAAISQDCKLKKKKKQKNIILLTSPHSHSTVHPKATRNKNILPTIISNDAISTCHILLTQRAAQQSSLFCRCNNEQNTILEETHRLKRKP